MNNIFVTRSSMPPLEEYMEEIKELWDTHWLTNMGPKHNQLKEQLLNYLGTEYVDLFVNGHMALEMAIQAFGFEEGSEVITTPFTFASTTHAIVRNGLIPVFCDIKDDTFTIDETQIEGLITSKTCAILPVHVYGNICNVSEIKKIADKYNLKVIYDAAHAFGEVYQGKGIGQYGDASVFSFHATKVFNTIEGGAVCFHDEEYGRRLYNLKNFGIRDEVTIEAVGANAKMNEFAAAMGICNLRHIEEEIAKRKEVFELYANLFHDISEISIPKKQDEMICNYAYYPIVINENKCHITRDDVYNILKKQGIYSRKYFYPLTCDFDCYASLYDSNEVTTARDISSRILTLPMYADLSTDEVNDIATKIKEIFK